MDRQNSTHYILDLGEKVSLRLPKTLMKNMGKFHTNGIGQIVDCLSWNLSRISAKHLLLHLRNQVMLDETHTRKTEAVDWLIRASKQLDAFVD